MRAWKHIVLLIGILGASGFFAPMVEVKQGRVAIEFSARRLSFDFDREHSALERSLPPLAEKYLPRSARSARDDARLAARVSRWVGLAYVPTALLALLGLAGVFRGRFGRLLGALTLFCGVASFAAWLGLHYGIPLALAEAELKHTDVSLLFGAHLLLLAGAAGVLAGLGALLRPDRGARPPRGAHPPGSLDPPGTPPPGFPPPPGPPPPGGSPPPAMPPVMTPPAR